MPRLDAVVVLVLSRSGEYCHVNIVTLNVVTFSDPNNIDGVIQSCPHSLDGRTIDPKPCNPRSMQKPKKNTNWPKVFLGGLPSSITETDLRSFFSRYGRVTEVMH